MTSAIAPPEASSSNRHESSPRPAAPGSRRERRRPPATPPSRALWNRAPWSLLFSLSVGLWLLAALAVASIIGTLIDPLERAQAVIYYTWWYKLLLLALAVNMACSTVKTIIVKIMPARMMRVQTSPAFFAESEPRGACAYAGDIGPVADAFRRQGCAVAVSGDAGVARRGWIGRWGAPVSHLGLVVVLLAGFASSWVAREGFVRIPEGHSVETMTLRGDDAAPVPLGFTLAVDDFSTGFFPRTRIPSHFESHVTATAGSALLYRGPVEVNNSPSINGWRLHQTSYEELPRVMRHAVTITAPGAASPTTVEVSIGQMVPVPGMEQTSLTLEDGGAWTVHQGTQAVASGRHAGSHGSALTLKAERFEPDFVLGADKQVTSRTREPNNPALQVTLSSDGAPALRQWLFGREDMKQFAHSGDDHYAVELMQTNFTGAQPSFTVEVKDGHNGVLLGRVELALGEEKPVGDQAAPDDPAADTTAGWNVVVGERVPAYATVMTLTRNPTIPVIYAGCGLMMLGLVLGFFVPRRTVWFAIDRAQHQLRVVGLYRHATSELDRATASLLAKVAAAPARQ